MTTGLRILDPTVEALPDTTLMAERPKNLNGLKVGLLSNGKRNAEELLDAVVALLQDTYELGEIHRYNKRDASRPCPQNIMDELLEKCDIAIVATGD